MTWLRAEFLWLFVLWLPATVWWITQQRQQGSWQKVIEAPLLSALTGDAKPSKSSPMWLLPLLTALILIALSGPSLSRNNAAGISQGNLFVVLDNSLSMAAEDVSPARLTRAKRLINDWASSGLFSKSSVLIYSASAHSLTPLTSDVATLNTQLQSVTPFIMPEFGNRPDLAFELVAAQLSQQSEPAHLLWISDDVEQQDVLRIAPLNLPAASKTFVAVGTLAGAPIPLPNDQGMLRTGNELAIAKADTNASNQAARSLGFQTASLNSPPPTNLLAQNERSSVDALNQMDIGFWLLIPIALGFLWHARQSLQVGGLMVLLLFSVPEQSTANTLFDNPLFENKEQQAFRALQYNNPDKTLALTERNDLAAQAMFQKADYENAAELFASLNTQQGFYNQGNALAHAGQLAEAVAAYEQALEFGPHPDAETNKQKIEEYLAQQPPQQAPNSSENSDSSQQQESDAQNSPQPQNSDTNPSENQTEPQNSDQQQTETEETESSESGTGSQQAADAQSNPDSDADQATGEQSQLAAEELQAEQQAEAILNQLQSQPGSLLQQKFRWQYQQNPTQGNTLEW